MTEESKIINILLLGETGVGKSTFINALTNYLSYNSFTEAVNGKLKYFVPTKFSFINEHFNEVTLTLDYSPDENQTVGASATRNVQGYLLKYKDSTIRLIDTPGIGDTRGLNHDDENTEKLLTFIGELKNLNAICVVLKPDNSRFSVVFDYCLKHILMRLDTNMHDNIIFLFTNTRATFYTPGETYRTLKTLLNDIMKKGYTIPFSNSNVFSTDNEAFRYLVMKSKGITLSSDYVEEYKKSWDKSTVVCKRMIDHILTLPSVKMQDIITVNESRRIVGRLGKPIVQLLTLYEKAVSTLKNHESLLKATKDTLHDLHWKLYVPVTHYKISEKTWSESGGPKGGFKGGFKVSKKFPFISLDLGYEYTWTDTRYTEIIITPYVTHVEDKSIRTALTSKEAAKEAIERVVTNMKKIENEYKIEKETILEAAVRFAIFLKQHALLSNEDVFENYLGLLLRSETNNNGDEKFIENLEDILVEYRVLKNKINIVGAHDITDSKNKLMKLKYFGNNFKQHLEKQFDFKDKSSVNVV